MVALAARTASFGVVLALGCARPQDRAALFLDAPRDGEISPRRLVRVAGRVRPAERVRVLLDGRSVAEVAPDPAGRFETTILAPDGLSMLEVRSATLAVATRFEVRRFARAAEGRLWLGDEPFRFVGLNAYYLHEELARERLGWPSSQGRAEQILAACRDAGVRVVRTWAFNDNPQSFGAIQVAPLADAEPGLLALDALVALAGLLDLRLVLALGNYWDDYGGVRQYLRWRGYSDETARAQFFRDPQARRQYAEHAARLAGRHNAVTGLRYADDPTILYWEVMNEPRGAGLASAEGVETVASFVAEVRDAIRAVDPNHPVASGEDGFDAWGIGYDLGAMERTGAAWTLGAETSQSFVRNLVTVDFASAHLYADAWGVLPDRAEDFAAIWIADHARLSAQYGRPLILGETAIAHDGLPERRRIAALDALLRGAYDEPSVAGVVVWGLTHAGRVETESRYAFTLDVSLGASPADDEGALIAAWAARFAEGELPTAAGPGAW